MTTPTHEAAMQQGLQLLADRETWPQKVCPRPECGSSDLATIEEFVAWSPVSVRVSPDGEADLDWHGSPNYGDGSTTVGAACRECMWEYRGTDWLAKLAETPRTESATVL